MTVHVLTKNNATTIQKCLESLRELDSKIVVVDIGSTDDTLDLCEDVSIVRANFERDYSKVRNDIVDSSTTDWQMWVEPWEILSNAEQILYATRQKENAYNVYSLQGGVLSKSFRLWRKSAGIKFVNPVYETLEPDNDRPLVQSVISGVGGRDVDETMSIVDSWLESNPHAPEAEYYKASTYLLTNRYDQFLSHANSYLFKAKKVSSSSIMTHYYIAMIMLHHRKKPEECIRHITDCLTHQPTMAEFWCLLGDSFVKLRQWHRATAFYDNAIVIGSRRRHDDSYPIEISKYKEYPEQMLNTCRDAIKKMHGS